MLQEAISKNTTKIISYLERHPSKPTNINQLAKVLNISVGSAHTILKNLETEGLVIPKEFGNAIIYTLDQGNLKVQETLELIGQEKKEILGKKTKIVATLGPASNNVEQIKTLIKNGMNIARINGAHGSERTNKEMLDTIREADPNVGILLDLPGTKIRLTNLQADLVVKKNDKVTLSSDDAEDLQVDIPSFHGRVKAGIEFTIDDGTIGLTIESVAGKKVNCIVQNDGVIKNRKGVNIPGLHLTQEFISETDKASIKFAIKNNITFIGLSFVRAKKDVQEVEQLVKNSKVKIIAKIETKKAIENYKEIIDAAYGVMIDRGDLSSEVNIEQIPRLQKKVIKECNKQGKPVIIATEMMHSMMQNPRPTKSEITDVANAVLDGASALMLSGETAVGKYPLETVTLMRKIIEDIEDEILPPEHEPEHEAANIAPSIFHIIHQASIDKVLCITHGGYSARMISRYKLHTPIIALTSDQYIVQRLSLIWGVTPLFVQRQIDNSASVVQKKEAVLQCLRKNLIDVDDTILIVGAVFPNHRKTINMAEIHKVSELLGFFGLSKADVLEA